MAAILQEEKANPRLMETEEDTNMKNPLALCLALFLLLGITGGLALAEDDWIESLYEENITDFTDNPLLIELFGEGNMRFLYPISGQISLDMPEWMFDLYGIIADEYGFESLVLIVRDEKGYVLDFFRTETETGAVEDPHVLLADVNFDGYQDVLFSEGAMGAHGNYWYNAYIWSPEDGAFWYAEDFYEIVNPMPDARDEVIRSRGANSAFEDIYSYYRFQSDLFLLDEELWIISDDELTYDLYQYDYDLQDRVLMSAGPFDVNDAKWGPDTIWKLVDPIWNTGRHYQPRYE